VFIGLSSWFYRAPNSFQRQLPLIVLSYTYYTSCRMVRQSILCGIKDSQKLALDPTLRAHSLSEKQAEVRASWQALSGALPARKLPAC
jgi:hypothetical protein